MKKIIILGSKGMAGHAIYFYLKENSDFSIVDIARDEEFFKPIYKMDIARFDEFEKILAKEKPDAIVNCIGVLNKDAEDNPDRAILLNSYLPHFLAQQGIAKGFKLVHISTDCVFSGKRGLYTENDPKDASGFYAETKSLGEVVYGPHVTLRTSIIGPELKASGIGLFDWFMKQTGTTKGYLRTIWSGVTTLELAKAVNYSIEHEISGLYHITNGEVISKYELLNLFKKYTNKNIDIMPVEGLVSDKSIVDTRKELTYRIPSYEEMIEAMIAFMRTHDHLYKRYEIS